MFNDVAREGDRSVFSIDRLIAMSDGAGFNYFVCAPFWLSSSVG